MAKRPRGFNNPFANLKLPTPPPAPKPPEPAAKPKPAEPPNVTEEALFDKEMRSVEPLPKDARGRRGPLGASLEIGRPPRRARAEDEATAYAELADLVEGQGAFDITSTDEYMEGTAPGLDRRILRKLRRGEFAVQAHLDLHGLVQEEARVELERFLDAARTAGKRCVLVIHGRGLHSKDLPVLKERMKVWLSRGRIGKAVLAFATARPADGGAGAVYVLLRK